MRQHNNNNTENNNNENISRLTAPLHYSCTRPDHPPGEDPTYPGALAGRGGAGRPRVSCRQLRRGSY